MSICATDPFTRANAATLGANWTKLSSFSDIGITSNAAIGQTAGLNVCAYTNYEHLSADHWAEVTIGTVSTDGSATVRSDRAGTFYMANFDPSTGKIWLYKCIATTFTQLATEISGFTFASGDRGVCGVQGQSVYSQYNGTTQQTVTDSAIDGTTVGGKYAGIFLNGIAMTFTKFVTGNFFVRPLLVRLKPRPFKPGLSR